MKAIKTNDEIIIPYPCIVNIKKISDGYYSLYDVLGWCHFCNESEANRFLNQLN